MNLIDNICIELIIMPDSLPRLYQSPIVDGRRQQFAGGLDPVRVAARRDGMTKNVDRFLPHAQVADDQPVVTVDMSFDEAAREPVQTVDRPDVICLL